MYLPPQTKTEMFKKWQLSQAEYIIVTYLIERFYDETFQSAYPQQTTLSELIPVSVRTIKRAIKDMESRGVIAIKKNKQFSKSNKKHIFERNTYTFPKMYVKFQKNQNGEKTKIAKSVIIYEMTQKPILENTTVSECQIDTLKPVSECQKCNVQGAKIAINECQSDTYLLKGTILNTKDGDEKVSSTVSSLSPSLDVRGEKKRVLGGLGEEPDTIKEKETGVEGYIPTSSNEYPGILDSTEHQGIVPDSTLPVNAESKVPIEFNTAQKEIVEGCVVNDKFIIKLNDDLKYLETFGFKNVKIYEPRKESAAESLGIVRKYIEDALNGQWRQEPFLYNLPLEAYEKLADPATLKKYLEVFAYFTNTKKDAGNYNQSCHFQDGRFVNSTKDFVEVWACSYALPITFLPVEYESIAEYFVANPKAAPVADQPFWDSIKYSYIGNSNAHPSHLKKKLDQRVDWLFENMQDVIVERYVSKTMAGIPFSFAEEKLQRSKEFNEFWKLIVAKRAKREDEKRAMKAAQEFAEKQEVPEVLEAIEKHVESRHEFVQAS